MATILVNTPLDYKNTSRYQRRRRSIMVLLQAMAAKAGSILRSRADRTDELPDTCIFCIRVNGELNRIACENRTFFARYDNFPANPGHVEIVPKRHVESFFELTEQEVVEAYSLIHEAREIIAKQHRTPHAFTIGINDGRAAGRTIDHLHIHLIPRYDGDVEDPRGGIRQCAPNCDPDAWGAAPSG